MLDNGISTSVFGMTDTGRCRPGNEDAFMVSDLGTGQLIQSMTGGWHESRQVGARGLLLSVSDGMGGAAAGEVASAMTIGSLREWLCANYPGGDRSNLRAAVVRANEDVFHAAQSDDRRGMGATLSAVLIRGATAHIASVGDSRVYLIRGRLLTQLTRDHTYVQYMVDNGLISRADVDKSPYKNVLLQAMGQASDLSVDIGRLELRRGDRFLLSSDGLTNKVSEQELRDVAIGSGSLEAGCRCLVDLANARGGEDNITVVLAVVTGPGLPLFSDDEEAASDITIKV